MMKKALLLIPFLLPLFLLAQRSKIDFVEAGIRDTIGFSYSSLCRLEFTVVQPGEQWPSAKFNDIVCQVPTNLQDIPEGKVGLVVPYHGGDCHAQFGFTHSVDEDSKQVVYHIYDYYGGCRAGGYYFVRFTHVPAPPEGYEVVVREHMIENGQDRSID
jgi:hypothetical protein